MVPHFNSNASSRVIINGHLSNAFAINRGCRQGDTLSPYLFVIAVEILALMIRKNKLIKGIKIDDVNLNVTQYADDTTVILDGTEKSLEQVLTTLDTFQQMCGLKINQQKTSVVWIGNRKGNSPICSHLNLDWKLNGKFDMLGVTFDTDLKNMTQIHFTKAFESMQKTIDIMVKALFNSIWKSNGC